MYKKEKKTRNVGVVVGLIKNFRRGLLGEERKESEKREKGYMREKGNCRSIN